MRKIKARKGADPAQLREEFAAAGLAVTVGEPDSKGEVEVAVPDGVHGADVDIVLRRHVPRALLQKMRTAGTVANLRDALGDVLELLIER